MESNDGPIMSLEGHEKGVNSLDFIGEKWIVSGSDDKTLKIWNLLDQKCVATLEGHSHNVDSVCFDPDLNVIISCSEDETIKVWDWHTFK